MSAHIWNLGISISLECPSQLNLCMDMFGYLFIKNWYFSCIWGAQGPPNQLGGPGAAPLYMNLPKFSKKPRNPIKILQTPIKTFLKTLHVSGASRCLIGWIGCALTYMLIKSILIYMDWRKFVPLYTNAMHQIFYFERHCIIRPGWFLTVF